MTQTTVQFARSVTDAWRELIGFEATESIRGGGFEIEAHVRTRRPGRVRVEYQTYRNPLLELEEEFGGGAEYTEEELTGLALTYTGSKTWIEDARTSVFVCKPHRALFEPLVGFDAIGELGFLDTWVRDFLLRDLGEDEIAGRNVRTLRIKPKQPVRSHLLTVASFPIRYADLSFDTETLFPVRIRLTPSPDSPLARFLASGGDMTVEYSNVKLAAPDKEIFTVNPEQEDRVFIEESIDPSEFDEKLPFPCDPEAPSRAQHPPIAGRTVATIDEAHDRGYVLIPLSAAPTSDQQNRSASLLTGNYLSRNMARRRALLAEKGETVLLGDLEAKLLDRRADWAERFPHVTPAPLLELSWEEHGVYSLLLAEGFDRDEILTLAKALTGARDADAADASEATPPGAPQKRTTT